MTFNIHQVDELDSMSEGAEEEFNTYRDELLQLFSDSLEGRQPREKYPDMVWWADMFMDLGFRYLGNSIPTLDVSSVRELISDLFPRKISLQSREEALDAIPELIAFWSFLQREYHLKNAASILKYLKSCSPNEFADSMFDRSKAGMAKSFFLSGQEAGFDMPDKRQIDEFMLLYNASQTLRTAQEQKIKKKVDAKKRKSDKPKKLPASGIESAEIASVGSISVARLAFAAGESLHENSQSIITSMNSRLQQIEQICREYQVKILYVFGSRSAEIFQAIQSDTLEIQTSQSDVDIGVLTHSSLSIDQKVGLTLELEQLFNVPRVDLVILQEADAFLAANIIRGERIFAEDSYLADEYELFVLRRAGDLAQLERERMAMILQEG